MAALGHILSFAVACALIVLAYCVFLFLANRLDRIPKGLTQEILGGLSAFGLLFCVGVVIHFFSLSFFGGILLLASLVFLYYVGKNLYQSFCPLDKAVGAKTR